MSNVILGQQLWPGQLCWTAVDDLLPAVILSLALGFPSSLNEVRPPHMPMALSIATLYGEELKATMRGRFAWLGAAVILLAVGGLATVGTQDTWLDGFGMIAYGLVPMSFIPLAAGFIAGPRANRFVESVFTAPVERL